MPARVIMQAERYMFQKLDSTGASDQKVRVPGSMVS